MNKLTKNRIKAKSLPNVKLSSTCGHERVNVEIVDQIKK